MTQRNRKTLADNFMDGRMPTQASFGDMIDSMVNIVDDGIDKSPKDGLKISQLNNNNKLLSFYDEITVKDSLWSLAFSLSSQGEEGGNLRNMGFYCGSSKYAGLTLVGTTTPEMPEHERQAGKIRLGVNKQEPEYELDVVGIVASDGRAGRSGEIAVMADGRWHPILTGLAGCQAFEVMAGVGKEGTGRYALLHAFALNTFNSKPGWFSSTKGRINYHQSHCSSKCDQIELRWVDGENGYSLEMRTRCDYRVKESEELYIRYTLSQLWFDPFMANSTIKSGENIKPRLQDAGGRTEIPPAEPQNASVESSARIDFLSPKAGMGKIVPGNLSGRLIAIARRYCFFCKKKG